VQLGSLLLIKVSLAWVPRELERNWYDPRSMRWRIEEKEIVTFSSKSSRILGRGPMLISSSKQITFNLGFVGARISHCSVGGISTACLKWMIRGWKLIIGRNWLKKMASSPWERERGKSTLDFFPFISKYLPWTFGDRRMYLLHQLLLPYEPYE